MTCAFYTTATTMVNVELNTTSDLNIVNALGQTVYSSRLVSGRNKVNLAELPNGIYIVQIKSESRTETIKLIKN